ncbi:DUF6364 family protein [Belliella aquatica]|uniref:Addiction module antitoxin, RelB/DinJ family n=1 Tax=Belliella aquatica TaxID=1323734 RepID=A0ABQ1MX24_9BACT|nr:DUF6364 family protein [Belliella aquatica]MCH7406808.1 DUF6364 family protein [Belliella aquatica]GGC48291.1 hypothetical protein GCM10010993_28470 [Belliella aquatica]
MDLKITLSLDQKVIEKAKEFASKQNISLSRLTEFLYAQITSGDYKTLDEMPVADWIEILAEGQAEYKKSPSLKKLKSTYFDSEKLELIEMLININEESILQNVKVLLEDSSNIIDGLSEEDYKVMDQRRERHLAGQSKSFFWEEVKDSARSSIK